MYQEVALDPQCLSEYHYYGLLKSNFGFEAGRYVIAPAKSWVREAVQAVKASKDMQPVRKQSIKNFLNKIQKNKGNQLILLPKYRTDIRADTWSEWCQSQIYLSPFNSVISETFAEAISYDDVIESNESWILSPTVQINKTAQEIIAVIEPLLNFGGDVTIVDQYFCPMSNPVFDAILAITQKTKAVKSIRLVTSVNVNNPVQSFSNEYLAKYPNSPKIVFVVAQERLFHDRYVISDLGAIKSGHGFSEAITKGTQADKLSINLCGQEEAESTKHWIDVVIEDGRATTTILHGG